LVRSGKADVMKAAYLKYGDRVDVAVADDHINGDFTDALKGVRAIIHIATPLPGRQSLQSTIDIAVEGTLNIVRQGYASGIRDVSYVASIVTFVEPGAPVYTKLVRSTDWNPLTEEDSERLQDDLATYAISKTLAEKALWKFAEEHKDFNLVTVGPTTFIGPLTPEFLEYTRPGDIQALSTSIFVYNFLTGPPATVGNIAYGYVDVRDVARALIAGIRPKVPGNHRLLLGSLPWFDNADIIAHIAAIRPDLKDRLIRSESSGQKGFIADEEITKTVQVLGLESVTPWKKTVEDSLESVLELERLWKEKGVDVDEVLGKNWSLDFWHRITVSRVELD